MKLPPFLTELDRMAIRPTRAAGRRPAGLAASRWPLRAILALGIWLTVGCDRRPDVASPETVGPRIVSLSPAMTTMLIDIGAGDALVGRTPWCRGIEDRPVVGTLEGVDAEVLVAIAPTVVVHQPPATGTDPVLEGLRDRIGFELIGGRLDGIGDIDRMLERFDRHDLGDPEAVGRWRRRLEDTFSSTGALEAEAPLARRPRVAIVHSVDPFGVAGAGTYLDEVVIAAGGVNAIGEPGWRTVGAETMLALSPDVVLLVGGGGLDEMATRLGAMGWSVAPRVLQMSDPDAMEPSTRICDVADRVARLLRMPDPEGGGR